MLGKLKNNLFYEGEMTEKDYKRSKICITVADISHGFGGNFTAAAYITALLGYMGAGEGLSSAVISLGVFAPVFQCVAPGLLAKAGYKKPIHFFCHFFRLLFCGSLLLLPLFLKPSPVVTAVIGIFYLVAALLIHMPGGAYNAWFMSLAEHGNIYRYMGIKESVTNLCMAGAYLYIAFISEYFSGMDQKWFFAALGIPTLIFMVVEAVALLNTKEPKTHIPKVEGSILKNCKEVILSKEMRPYIRYQLIFSLTGNLVSIVWSVFMVQRLKLPLSIVSLIYLIDLGLRCVFSVQWGKIIGKIGYLKALAICVIILFIETVMRGFIFESNKYIMIFAICIVTAVANSGFSIANFNYYYRCIPEEKKATYSSYYNAMVSPVNWLFSLIGSLVITVFNKQTVSIFGMEFSEMNMLFLIASVGYIFSAVAVFKEYKRSRLV